MCVGAGSDRGGGGNDPRGGDHGRDRRGCAPGVRGEGLLPVAPELLQLPQVVLHLCERGRLPRHPRPQTPARRRHRQCRHQCVPQSE